jgi:predicted acetyltransferase
MAFLDKPQLIPATLADYPVIQNMARFYVYDLSRDCGFISKDWALPSDGLYESSDFKHYFEDSTRQAFLVKVEDELAGFVLLNQAHVNPKTERNIGEFFILAKFQGKGIGRKVANQLWETYPQRWEVSVIPENKKSLSFWRQAISDFTKGQYSEEVKRIDYDLHQPNRIIFSFDTNRQTKEEVLIRPAVYEDAEDVERVRIQSWKESYRGLIDQSFLDQLSFEKSLKMRQQILQANTSDKIFLVAVNQGQIIGFCDAGPNRIDSDGFPGEVYAIYLLEEYKHLGIGKKLFSKACDHLIKKELTPYLVWTLEENQTARRFYEKMGGTLFSKRIDKIIGDPEYKEVGYIFEAITIESAQLSDISAMVSLSYQKRRAYEKAQPRFWRHAEKAEESQTQWFEKLFMQKDYRMLIARAQGKVIGFIIGQLINAPEVYDPNGLTLMVDDFCVESVTDWTSIGNKLLNELKYWAKEEGAMQVVIVTGHHDEPKRQFLKNFGLNCASEWYVGDVA